MVLQFSNPFLSVAGQVERLKNVAATLNAAFNPFSSQKVQANTSSAGLNAGLEAFANHPYVTAGVIAGGVTAVNNPSKALALAKSLIPKSVTGKIAAAAAVPIVAGVVASNPIASFNAVAQAPSSFANFGYNVGDFAQNPSVEGAKKIFRENPIVAGIVGTLGVIGVGGGLGLAANTIATLINSKATRQNTEATTGGSGLPAGQSTSNDGSLVTDTSTFPSGGQGATNQVTSGNSSLSPRRRSSRKPQKPQNISQKVNIVVDTQGNDKYIKETVIRKR